MSTVTRRRAKPAANMIIFPEDYPHPRRAQNAAFIRHALGGIAPSTFFKYRATGLIPKPDLRTGSTGRWFEPTIAAIVDSFANREVA